MPILSLSSQSVRDTARNLVYQRMDLVIKELERKKSSFFQETVVQRLPLTPEEIEVRLNTMADLNLEVVELSNLYLTLQGQFTGEVHFSIIKPPATPAKAD